MPEIDKAPYKLTGHNPTFLASADLHLGKKLYNIPELEEDLLLNFQNLCTLALDKEVEYLVVAGDLFENNQPDPSTLAFVQAQVSRLRKKGVLALGIAGDHDKPVKGGSWNSVAGFLPLHTCRHFTGEDYHDYSLAGTSGLMQRLVSNRPEGSGTAEDVRWVFLHCQFPQLFQFTENKKKVDFGEVDPFLTFPNLQGIIAGDIHAPLEGLISDRHLEAYLGYCGSLGITDISEADKPRSVLHCNGQELVRLEFPQRRKMVRISFKDGKWAEFNLQKLLDQYSSSAFKPVFSVDCDAESEARLGLLKPLHDIGFVRTSRTARLAKPGSAAEQVNIRSEIKTAGNVESALEVCCSGDEPSRLLLSSLLSSADPKIELDAFKTGALK